MSRRAFDWRGAAAVVLSEGGSSVICGDGHMPLAVHLRTQGEDLQQEDLWKVEGGVEEGRTGVRGRLTDGGAAAVASEGRGATESAEMA
eukprot:CAMPEP_0194314492 /NCGR_PEP_ID=MMETSP0171-20130528/11341_1 /TAXON_ID=218684 /ORGANISM="Corethron pennatum, Strain L29A3" /LENGTH=88 /DNA_ID=CAMNT_0039069925 /DNA_START=263 /DNA_END=527 /DNA_ORIENTATION=+